VRRENQHEVESQTVPIDLPERGDARGHLHSQSGDGDRIPHLQPEQLARLRIHRDKRRPGIVARPPAATGDAIAGGQIAGKGQPAIAAQDPRAFGQILHRGDALPLQFHDRPAQRGDGHHLSARSGGADGLSEPHDLGRRHVEHEESRRAGGDTGAELPGQVGLDHRQRSEQAQPQPERDDQPVNLRGGAVQPRQRQPEQRTTRPANTGGEPADAEAEPRQQHKQPGRRAKEGRRKPRLPRRPDRQQRGEQDGGCDTAENRQRRTGARLHHAAKQGGSGDRAGAGNRGERKGGSDQQPIGGGDQQRQRIKTQPWRHRQRIARQHAHQSRHQCADNKRQQDRAGSDDADLQQVQPKNQGRACPDRLQRGDGLPLAIQIGTHAVTDTDPGDHQSRQPHEGEKLANPLDEAADAGGAVAPILHPPARFGKMATKALGGGLGVGGDRNRDAVLPVVQAAGLDKLRGAQRRHVYQRGRPEAEPLPRPVWLRGDQPGDEERRLADADALSDINAQPIRQCRRDQHRPPPRPSRAGARRDGQRAVKRVAGIDALEFGEHRLRPVRPRRHRPHRCGFG
jgi:hypothetical protein